MIEISPRTTHKMTLDEAKIFALFYEYDGKKGWRLPTRAEYVNNPKLDHHIWYTEKDFKTDISRYTQFVKDV